LLNALNLFVCAPVDLVEVLTKPIQKPADFFRDACHAEKLIGLADVVAGCTRAPATKTVD
jgi:hypothetical protein